MQSTRYIRIIIVFFVIVFNSSLQAQNTKGKLFVIAGGHRSDPRADVYRPFRTAFDNAGDEHPGLSLHHLAYFYGTFSDSALERRNFANRKLQRHGRWAGDHVIPVDDLPGTGDVV